MGLAAEKVRLRIGNLGRAVLVTGQAYQDPKDALNEFVSNAADEYVQAGVSGGRIRILMRRRGRYPAIVIDDDGRGMDQDRLREVARNLFNSQKAGDDATLGEKAIGMLAFQQLGGRLDIVSRTADSHESWVLKLERGKVNASLDLEKRRARDRPGTTVYLGNLDREVLRMLTQRKVVDYLRRRRAAALASGAYEIEVVEGRSVELVTPEEPDGMKVPLAARNTLWGRVEFAIYVAPPDSAAERAVSVVGRAGTTIVDSLTELDEFDRPPWNNQQVSGRVLFDSLQQSAGRRAILRDDEVWPAFVESVRSIEPMVSTAAERVRVEMDRDTTDRMNDRIRKVFGRVLKELEDLDNPMRTPVGDLLGDGGILAEGATPGTEDGSDSDGSGADNSDTNTDDLPTVADLTPEPPVEEPPALTESAKPGGRRSKRLPTLTPDPEPTESRSRFDPEAAVVFYNESHPDYLLVKDDEAGMIDYLATLVAKEYVVYNNPMAAPDELSEEMVRMLIRVRRQLQR